MAKKISKPWGYEIIFAKTKDYAGKLIFVRKGETLSYQYHQKKEETIFLFKGRLEITHAKNKKRSHFIMKAGDSYHIPPWRKHRFHALADSYIFEVSTPELNDVVRLEDKYGRIE
jgi:mannose-6-phosphate isomerase-like protein (cupin superfamily)